MSDPADTLSVLQKLPSPNREQIALLLLEEASAALQHLTRIQRDGTLFGAGSDRLEASMVEVMDIRAACREILAPSRKAA